MSFPSVMVSQHIEQSPAIGCCETGRGLGLLPDCSARGTSGRASPSAAGELRTESVAEERVCAVDVRLTGLGASPSSGVSCAGAGRATSVSTDVLGEVVVES